MNSFYSSEPLTSQKRIDSSFLDQSVRRKEGFVQRQISLRYWLECGVQSEEEVEKEEEEEKVRRKRMRRRKRRRIKALLV